MYAVAQESLRKTFMFFVDISWPVKCYLEACLKSNSKFSATVIIEMYNLDKSSSVSITRIPTISFTTTPKLVDSATQTDFDDKEIDDEMGRFCGLSDFSEHEVKPENMERICCFGVYHPRGDYLHPVSDTTCIDQPSTSGSYKDTECKIGHSLDPACSSHSVHLLSCETKSVNGRSGVGEYEVISNSSTVPSPDGNSKPDESRPWKDKGDYNSADVRALEIPEILESKELDSATKFSNIYHELCLMERLERSKIRSGQLKLISNNLP